MQLRWTWQALTLCHLFINFSNASPLVHPAISKTTSAQRNLQEPSLHHQPIIPAIGYYPSQARPPTDLRHRAITNSFDFTGLAFQVLTTELTSVILPIRSTAFILARFYDKMLDACLSDWQKLPEVSTLFYRLGDLQLTVVSDGGTIPWILVANFAASWYAHTKRGMVSTYRVVYATHDLRHGVQFSLDIVGRAWGLSHGPL